MTHKNIAPSNARTNIRACIVASALLLGMFGSAPVAADTDQEGSSTAGKCMELRINGEQFSCDRLIAIYTKHSRRMAYALETPTGTLQFVGDQGMELPPHDHLLLVTSIVDRNTTRQATGQCRATRGNKGRAIKRLSCDVSYEGGSIRGVFSATGASQDISL